MNAVAQVAKFRPQDANPFPAMGRFGIVLAALMLVAWQQVAPARAEPSHGIAMHGRPALPADFTHLPYANPDAPKGGAIRYGVIGNFVSLNQFIVKAASSSARGIWDSVAGLNVFEPLLHRSRDEPFTLYGLLAETVETDAARTFVEFHLREQARFADGAPVTPEDVLFSIRLLGEKGRPFYRSRWGKIASAEKVGERGVRFTFNEKADRELPLLLGMMPIFPKHAIDEATFDQTTLKPMFGSGPYTITDVRPGERIEFTLRDDYWAKDLPVKRGFDNFGTIRFEYFRTQNTLFEGFKKGLFDVYFEGDPQHWQNAYDFPAAADGRIVREGFARRTPSPMLGFVFNTRRPPFDDIDVRKGLAMAFDFEWVNRNLFGDAYTRTASFWHGSILSSAGVAADEREHALLAPFPGRVDEAIMDGTYRMPRTDASGADRSVQRRALGHFKAAGYQLKDNRLVSADGQPLSFEVMTQSKDGERLALAWQRHLAPLGVELNIRGVDATQFESRRQSYEFDVVLMTYSASLSPGAEQIWRWGSRARDIEGTFNLAGIADPAVDAAIDAMLAAKESEDFIAAIRVLDRLLISGQYLLPLYHLGETWVAHSSRLAGPADTPLYGVQFPTWWDRDAQ